MKVNPITQAERIRNHRESQDLIRGRAFLLQCSWCKRFKIKNKWIKFDPKMPHVISHGICPDCQLKQMERLKNAGNKI